jgi:hypothetical protein
LIFSRSWDQWRFSIVIIVILDVSVKDFLNYTCSVDFVEASFKKSLEVVCRKREVSEINDLFDEFLLSLERG